MFNIFSHHQSSEAGMQRAIASAMQASDLVELASVAAARLRVLLIVTTSDEANMNYAIASQQISHLLRLARHIRGID